MTVGIVSALGRGMPVGQLGNSTYTLPDVIQTDAAINPGNSGGPLINGVGEAVGINSAVSSEGQGISFAVPINTAKEILAQLKANGRVSRGYLGVQLQELDPELQRLFSLPDAKGAMVLDVIAGGAGEAAGLKRYDVIRSVSERPVEDGDQLIRTISALSPGSSVTLRLVRDGKAMMLTAQLAERTESPPSESNPAKVEPAAVRGDALGLVVSELSTKARSDLSLAPDKAGVVVKEVVGLDPGADPIEHGDLIVEVNRKPTPTIAAYEKALGGLKAGEGAWLLLYRPRPAAVYLTRIEVATPTK
jgi:serine protease Do